MALPHVLLLSLSFMKETYFLSLVDIPENSSMLRCHRQAGKSTETDTSYFLPYLSLSEAHIHCFSSDFFYPKSLQLYQAAHTSAPKI